MEWLVNNETFDEKQLFFMTCRNLMGSRIARPVQVPVGDMRQHQWAIPRQICASNIHLPMWSDNFLLFWWENVFAITVASKDVQKAYKVYRASPGHASGVSRLSLCFQDPTMCTAVSQCCICVSSFVLDFRAATRQVMYQLARLQSGPYSA